MYLYTDRFKDFTITCNACKTGGVEIHLDSEEMGYCPSCSYTRETIEITCLACHKTEKID